MTTVSEILEAAEKAQVKGVNLEDYIDAIARLREKDYSWRDIANFFSDQGIKVDHTKIARIAKANYLETNLSSGVPSCDKYVEALKNLAISPDSDEFKMLIFHYNQPNRTVTYTQLANSVGKGNYRYANKVYGNLGKKLCTELGFEPFKDSSGKPFFGSIIGMKYAYAAKNEHFQLVMHHELSKAILILYPNIKGA